MIELALLGMFVLGGLLTGLLVVPLWREDRNRLDARVTELLHLLESRSAPLEYAAYVSPPPADPLPDLLYDETGLLSVEVDD